MVSIWRIRILPTTGPLPWVITSSLSSLRERQQRLRGARGDVFCSSEVPRDVLRDAWHCRRSRPEDGAGAASGRSAVRLLHVAGRSDPERARRLRVRGRDHDRRRARAIADLLRAHLRVDFGAGHRGTGRGRVRPPAPPRAGEMPGRIGMRAEADHDVEQHDRDAGIGERGCAAHRRVPSDRSSDAGGRA